ncbi:heterokaryon incompatibility [Exophiala viscosa]|uniref:heterokaryon incompatibility n=1 Tax=Exophiala viscosa TaxID=2486360 RepID=UPI0021994019|nr:heterokaryon incompatibility [Exophiala viscosa]
MRLLRVDDHGELSAPRYISGDAPPYAILSHTWGEQEVTLNDLTNGSSKTMTGYTKIQLCLEQAKKDGLQYVWVDTCCIDKSSSAELQEAINSMFRWYQHASICYVYLEDVLGRNRLHNSAELYWESTLRQSRWFTRSWTLQELIAPPVVEFFSRDFEPLGDRRSLEAIIHEITAIPIQVLRGTSVFEYSTEERLSWAAKRQSTRTEDGAYSLLGIFNTFMPLIYGEGQSNAFARLRRKISKSSRYDSSVFNLESKYPLLNP